MPRYLNHFEPDLPARAFRKAIGKNRPETLEGGKGGSAPSAPDPWVTSAATTASNQQTAAYNKALNLGNYSNPFGGQSSSISGYDSATGAPIYRTDVTANPQLQGAMNGLFGQIGLSAPITNRAINNLYGIEGQYGNLANSLSPEAAQNAQQQGQDAAYKSQTQYLDPQFSQQQESLKAQLANQGLTPGSQAYDNAMLNFNNQKQQAYSNAQNQSILTGSQIGTQNWQNQLAGVNTKAGLFGDMADTLGRQVSMGQTPYSNLQTVAGMIPGYSGPATSGAQPADIAGYMNNQYQGQLAGYNARQASNNSTMGAVGTVAAMAAMAGF